MVLDMPGMPLSGETKMMAQKHCRQRENG